MNKLEEITVRIIKEQELIIGPIAWDEAKRVEGLTIQDNSNVAISGDPKLVVNGLVSQYERLFGRASEEVCREAAAPLLVDLPASEIPSSLMPA